MTTVDCGVIVGVSDGLRLLDSAGDIVGGEFDQGDRMDSYHFYQSIHT
jgi:hypothetical protein